MNYRHAYHAGNFADVLKHTALVAVLLHLRKKESAFAVIDTHAGRGLYDLSGEEAKKTGEAESGVLRLFKADALTGVLGSYRELVREFGDGLYPGSPLVAAKLLRPQDRLVAIEKHPIEYQALAASLADVKNARAIEGDGYRELPKLLPPRERRGVILIDPPYEAEDEFSSATRVIIEAQRRFASGIFLFWYPAKMRPVVAATAGEFLTAGIASLTRVEFDTGAAQQSQADGRGPPMTATGLLVINPPYGFSAEMKAVVGALEQLLPQTPAARGIVEVLAER